VTVKASAGGSDGGGGGKTLQVRINGGSWTDSGTSFSKTYQVKSGGNVKIEARVKNGKGLVSGVVNKTQPAQKWTPPAPKAEYQWGAHQTVDGCYTSNCRRIDVTVTGLEPGSSHSFHFRSMDETGAMVNWGQDDFTATGSGTWNTNAQGGHQWVYGDPNHPLEVWVDGKKIAEQNLP
jgi:hypothetical protein